VRLLYCAHCGCERLFYELGDILTHSLTNEGGDAMTGRFQHVVSITEHDQKYLEALQKCGVKIVDVFRRGLAAETLNHAEQIAKLSEEKKGAL